jgi:AraC-like DNA-binding protein
MLAEELGARSADGSIAQGGPFSRAGHDTNVLRHDWSIQAPRRGRHMRSWASVSPSLFAALCVAREHLRDCEETALPVTEIACRAGLSPFRFIRLFRAVFGTTPHQYRIDARLDRARELLITTDRAVTEICLDVGFTSLGSFSSLFTRRIGAPPSSYRRRTRPMIVVPGQMPVALAPGCLSLMAAAFAISEKRQQRIV